MSTIKFKHSENIASSEGPRAALPTILQNVNAKSILDVGCGTGTWLKAAMELGLNDLLGVDGISLEPEHLLIPREFFKIQDLTTNWQLGRKYDLVLCLEVAEHLEEKYASPLIDSLTSHGDTLVFAAACPGQPGQHHLNCQWPYYWQKLFNSRGFVCSDELRPLLWRDTRIEPWYRQNIFVARRNEKLAGKEEPLKAMVHADLMGRMENDSFSRRDHWIRDGRMPIRWYLELPFTVLRGRFNRK